MNTGNPPTLVRLISSGTNFLRRYTGTVTAVYLLQTTIALLASWMFCNALKTSFDRSLLLDDAANGDFLALRVAYAEQPQAFNSGFWIGTIAVLLYVGLSWLTSAGLLSVAACKPKSRQATLDSFFAGAANHSFAFARLAVLSVPLWVGIFWVWRVGVSAMQTSIDGALSYQRFLSMHAIAAGPALLGSLFVATTIAYARIELVLAGNTGALRSLVRAAAFVAKHPMSLAHSALYPLGFAVVSFGYFWLTASYPLTGAMPGLSVVVFGQMAQVSRFVPKIVVIAGQVAFRGALRPHSRH